MTRRTARTRSSLAMSVPGFESASLAAQPACFGSSRAFRSTASIALRQRVADVAVARQPDDFENGAGDLVRLGLCNVERSGPVFRPVDRVAAYLDTSSETDNGTLIFGSGLPARNWARGGSPLPPPPSRGAVRVSRAGISAASRKPLPKNSIEAIIR
jgi:hypothetical protein